MRQLNDMTLYIIIDPLPGADPGGGGGGGGGEHRAHSPPLGESERGLN